MSSDGEDQVNAVRRRTFRALRLAMARLGIEAEAFPERHEPPLAPVVLFDLHEALADAQRALFAHRSALRATGE